MVKTDTCSCIYVCYLQEGYKTVTQEFRSHYRCPQKSITASVLTKRWSKQSRPVVCSAVQQLNVQPDDSVLEIGYGRGDGIEMLLDKLQDGVGAAYGLELSPYMNAVASNRFLLEMGDEDQKVFLDHANNVLVLLPYPTGLFDGIYHVDVFYFWRNSQIKEIVEELWRVLKPGKQLVCGMELSRLKKLEEQNILGPLEADPLRYLEHLEPAGFTDVKVIYRKIDSSGNETNMPGSREIQLIVARKPEPEDDEDPDVIFQNLREDILEDLVEHSISKSNQAQPKHVRKSTSKENLEIL
uniref:Methyltransferase domain-containing protein n=1 Tax=Ditylenchus dipsaci TaxID=166011 RepID=A0A915EMA9_9BILA